MAETRELKLYGLWASPLSMAVEIALKLKGLDYEYIQEDLAHKSEALLRYNPIHKKIPVLVHNGKPLAETVVILQYIEESWEDEGPRLLPLDSFRRSRIRFWIDFIHNKLAPISRTIFLSEGERRLKAVEELAERINAMDEGTREDLHAEERPLDLLDIAMGTFCFWLRALGDIAGEQLVVAEKTGGSLLAALAKLEAVAGVRELLPEHGELVEYAMAVRDGLKVFHGP
ncbi:unnamed protein product [Spirodela intermedia]|uniref:Glutathione S-transferase n=2 Tax=Spirodela intermedia TaxID=51605 RepID=A0A7I8KSI1_SPIIN|nr:unnamed protein product [Spirodela intermedia]CAA6663789.1 unnamed protein product [Spirodela intermedia]CAA7400286.1 unnamed protein product [Spirodela intermedia]